MLRALAEREMQQSRRAAAPVDPDTFFRAFQAFYGAAARATPKPSPHGSAHSHRGGNKAAHTVPELPPVAACLAAAHDVLLREQGADRTNHLVRLIALDTALGGGKSGQLALLEALTAHGIGEEALARAAAVAPLFKAHGYRFFATDDLVRLSAQPG